MPRVEVDCPASVREDGTIHRVRVRDVSQGGIKVDSTAEIGIGSDVIMTVPGLAPQPGVVRWSDSGCYGITFNRVLPLPVLVSWLHQQRQQLRAAG